MKRIMVEEDTEYYNDYESTLNCRIVKVRDAKRNYMLELEGFTQIDILANNEDRLKDIVKQWAEDMLDRALQKMEDEEVNQDDEETEI
jgi:hypothetical protein